MLQLKSIELRVKRKSHCLRGPSVADTKLCRCTYYGLSVR